MENMHVVDSVVKQIKSKVDTSNGFIGIILGEGFASFTDYISDRIDIPFSSLSQLKTIGKDSEGKFVFGKIGDKNVCVMLGRLHYNYGYEEKDIAHIIFILKELNCKKLILTASLGSINPKIKVGDIVSSIDHINLTGRNPLYKCDYLKYGHTFVNMLSPYDEAGIDNLTITAKHEMNIKIKKGVLVEFAGPSSETLAEAVMARELGADFVGFNVCNEVIACRYCNLDVTLFGLITNFGSSLSANCIKHDDIVYNRSLASVYYNELLKRFVITI